ncbi:MAG TPA: hypothetical protein VNX68_13340 [Nitrosopumilaceae archaeon]|jgi:hypothetical protein|nr:hypothetical protein [Nitrosopumilaceae archaeon]
MKTINELNSRILAITMLIKEKHPELQVFLGEMSETIPDNKNPDINRKALEEYCSSLEDLLKKYTVTHPPVFK